MAPLVHYQVSECPVTSGQLAGWKPAPEHGMPASVTGPCPRCEHSSDDSLPPPKVVDYAAFDDKAVAKAPAPVAHDPTHDKSRRIDCNCSADHPGRPKDATQGCGAWWQITMVRQSDGTWRVEPGDPEMAAAATALAKEITAGELKSVRAAAEKWIAGVAAIYGLFSLAAALVAKTTVPTLPTPARVTVVALASVSLLGALASILASYSAAYGWPTLTDVEYDTGLLKWFAHQQDRLPKAVHRLHQAVYCAVASLAALAIAFGIVWLFPPASPALVTVTFNQQGNAANEGSQCGQLTSVTSTDLGMTILTGPSEGNSDLIPVGWLVTTTPVSSC
jgi:hypothetical protein